jgi:type II secretory pathway component GspD/PulD (secretin)
MDTRFFKVRAALITRIAGDNAGEGGDGAGGGDSGMAGGDMEMGGDFFDPNETFNAKPKSTAHTVLSEHLKAYFEERGVPFPEGSTIAYNRRSGRLSVTNTLENLRRLDMLLRALDMEQPQVLIESKFVEINQKAIEELGFEWWMQKSSPTDRKSLGLSLRTIPWLGLWGMPPILTTPRTVPRRAWLALLIPMWRGA